MDTRAYWRFCNERHAIYMRRQAGQPWPWTKDKILQTYRFTNVYRQLDAVTVALNSVLDAKTQVLDPTVVLFNIIAFRLFNWPPTYHRLFPNGWCEKWVESKALHTLAKIKADGEKIFTGAYIVTNSGQSEPKHVLAARALTEAWHSRQSMLRWIAREGTMEGATAIIQALPMHGPFTAYEVVCDLRYTPILSGAPDKLTWANAGPGARRGLNRLLKLPVRQGMSQKDAIPLMVGILKQADEQWQHMPALELREVEHTLCEFDKYERVRLGEGRPRSRYAAP